MGGKKVVVLAGYKTLKEALVNYADVFGLRERILIIQEFSKEHGKHGGLYVSISIRSAAALSRHAQVNSRLTIIHREHLRCHLGAAGAHLLLSSVVCVFSSAAVVHLHQTNKQTSTQTDKQTPKQTDILPHSFTS